MKFLQKSVRQLLFEPLYFPLSCGGNLILQRRTAKLLADNQRMAKSIQTKLGQQRNAGQAQ